MPLLVDIRVVLAVVVPIVVGLLGTNVGLIVFIIKGLVRRYDPLITEVAELKQDSVRSEERLRASNDRIRDMIELMDAKLESLIVRHGMLEQQHREARERDAERDAERLRQDAERRKIDDERRKMEAEIDAQIRKLDAARDADRQRHLAVMQGQHAEMQRDISELQEGLREIKARIENEDA